MTARAPRNDGPVPISEAARRAGVSARMVRHYEALGLLNGVGRTDSGYRQYTEAETARREELRSEIEAIDGRITANLEMEVRSQQIEGGINSMLGAMIERDSGEVIDTRSIGQRFASDEYRSWIESGGRGTSPMAYLAV